MELDIPLFYYQNQIRMQIEKMGVVRLISGYYVWTELATDVHRI